MENYCAKHRIARSNPAAGVEICGGMNSSRDAALERLLIAGNLGIRSACRLKATSFGRSSNRGNFPPIAPLRRLAWIPSTSPLATGLEITFSAALPFKADSGGRTRLFRVDSRFNLSVRNE
jgi:hypothetical protein